MHVTSDIIQTIWIVSPLTCKVIRRQIDIWIVSVVSILWILIPVSHLDSVSSVFLLDYGSHALALDCDPGLTLDSVYIPSNHPYWLSYNQDHQHAKFQPSSQSPWPRRWPCGTLGWLCPSPG